LRSGEPGELLPPDEDLVAESNDDHQLEVMFQNVQSIVSPMAAQPTAAPVAVAEGPATWESSSDPILIPTAIRERDTDPAPPPPELVAQLRDLVRQRDEASAEAHRLREENETLRCDLEDQNAEIERLHGGAERLLVVRAKCDQLFAEHVMMEREAAALQTRLTEVQVTLIGVEAELDEERSRYETQRRAWQEQSEIHCSVAREAGALRIKVAKLRALYDQTREERDEALSQVEALDQRVDTLRERCGRLSAYLEEAQTDRRVLDQTHQAEIDRLDAALCEALDEAESALERHVALETQVKRLQARLAACKSSGR
jgi:chromosome segregation ATPase